MEKIAGILAGLVILVIVGAGLLYLIQKPDADAKDKESEIDMAIETHKLEQKAAESKERLEALQASQPKKKSKQAVNKAKTCFANAKSDAERLACVNSLSEK